MSKHFRTLSLALGHASQRPWGPVNDASSPGASSGQWLLTNRLSGPGISE